MVIPPGRPIRKTKSLYNVNSSLPKNIRSATPITSQNGNENSATKESTSPPLAATSVTFKKKQHKPVEDSHHPHNNNTAQETDRYRNSKLKLPNVTRDPWKQAAENERKLKDSLKKQESEKAVLQNELTSWKEQHSKLSHQYSNCLQEMKDLRKQIQSTTEEENHVKKNYDNAQSDILQLQSTISSQNKKIKEMKCQFDALQRELHELQNSKNSRPENHTINTKDIFEKANKKILQFEEAHKEKFDKLEATYDNKLEKAVLLLDKTRKDIERLKKNAELSIRKEKTDCESRVKNEKQLREKVQGDLDKLRHRSYYESRDLVEKNRLNLELSESVQSLDRMLQMQQEEIKSWSAQTNFNKQDLSRAQAEFNKLEKQHLLLLAEKNKEIEVFKQKILTLSKEVETLKANNCLDLEKITALQNELETSKLKYQKIQETFESTNSKSADLEIKLEELNSLKASHMQLKKNLDEILSELEKKKAECQTKETQYNQFKEKFDIKIQDNNMEIAKKNNIISAYHDKVAAYKAYIQDVHGCYVNEHSALKSATHIEGLLKMASLSEIDIQTQKYKIMLDACQEENAFLRFGTSAAETQLKKYDSIASENITQNRRCQVAKVHEKMKTSQRQLEQRAEDASQQNSSRLRDILAEAKGKYRGKCKESEETFNKVLRKINSPEDDEE